MQVGIGGGKASSGGDGLVEGGVDASRFRIDQPGQCSHVGGFQLGERAVLDQLFGNLVIRRQVFQHAIVRGKSALGLFAGRQLLLFKEQLCQLLGGIDVDLISGVGVDFFGEGFQLQVDGAGDFPQHGDVQPDAVFLHPLQHRQQGQLDILVEAIQPEGCQPLFIDGVEPEHRPGVFRGVGAGGLHIHEVEAGLALFVEQAGDGDHLVPQFGQSAVVQRIHIGAGIEQIGCQHGVPDGVGDRPAVAVEHDEVIFEVVPQDQLAVQSLFQPGQGV